ncbi:MAG: hypothetical protein JST46_07490 [Bacteroidetes bacterium]|nr:hypothetical protein [Bacteroidota bacterium]
MLRYFRLNDPYRLIGLMLLMALLALTHFIFLPGLTLEEIKHIVIGEELGEKLLYVRLIDDTPPLMAITDWFLDALLGRSLFMRHVLALFILFLQAGYFAVVLINNKAYNESSYVPALVFAVLCLFSFDVISLSPDLLASFFLLLSLDNLFKEIEFRSEKDSLVLNLGIFLGMASLYVFSYVIFLFGSIILMVIFARTSLRKVLLLLFGFALVHGILWTVYYAYDHAEELWTHFYLPNLQIRDENSTDVGTLFRLMALPVIYFVISLFMLTREARFTRYQTQLFQSIFLWLLFAVIEIWVSPEIRPHSFIPFFPPLAYLISHYLLLIRRKWIAETMMFLLMFGVITVHYTSYFEKMPGINYESMFPRQMDAHQLPIVDKKVMVLDTDLSIYERNEMAGDFLNWNLSEKYFADHDEYDNIIRIREAMLNDPPDVIVDPNNVMAPILSRIPELETRYHKQGIFYEQH